LKCLSACDASLVIDHLARRKSRQDNDSPAKAAGISGLPAGRVALIDLAFLPVLALARAGPIMQAAQLPLPR
jgi:hypothetical protein